MVTNIARFRVGRCTLEPHPIRVNYRTWNGQLCEEVNGQYPICEGQHKTDTVERYEVACDKRRRGSFQFWCSPPAPARASSMFLLDTTFLGISLPI